MWSSGSRLGVNGDGDKDARAVGAEREELVDDGEG